PGNNSFQQKIHARASQPHDALGEAVTESRRLVARVVVSDRKHGSPKVPMGHDFLVQHPAEGQHRLKSHTTNSAALASRASGKQKADCGREWHLLFAAPE